MEITKKEFEFYLGKFCAIIGITNKGFADKIREILAQPSTQIFYIKFDLKGECADEYSKGKT